MKTTKLFFTGLFLWGALFVQAQVTHTSTLTRVGLQAGTGGTGNTFFGYQAGFDSDGNSNIFIGHNSGYAGSGTNNISIGYFSGKEVSGNDNIFIGGSSGYESVGSRNIYIGKYTGDSSNENDILKIDNTGSSNPLIWGDFAANLLKFNGKVGVGYGFGNFPTTAGTVNVSGYNLFVNGGILTEEVRVMLKAQWADYVFEEDYNLPKLQEVERFIKENKHLPNMPSAKEVAENGIELGEIAKIQQEKIEELTLYVIEQDKKVQQQQKEINELKEQVKLLLKNQK